MLYNIALSKRYAINYRNFLEKIMAYIVAATGNKHKLEEYRQLLDGQNVDVTGVKSEANAEAELVQNEKQDVPQTVTQVDQSS